LRLNIAISAWSRRKRPRCEVLLGQLVAERKHDLFLMGACGFHPVDRNTLGSTAEFLLRSLHCPVLVVGPSVKERPGQMVRLVKIVYASALPEEPYRAQGLVCELARKSAGHIHVVHAESLQASVEPRALLRNMEMREEKIADSFRKCGVGSSWTLRFGSQSDHGLEQAKVVSADLICSESHIRRRVQARQESLRRSFVQRLARCWRFPELRDPSFSTHCDPNHISA
jgi:universal stress protein family protein